jgi:hypothetical protein
MNTLELKHIAPYLPYGLKCQIGGYVNREILGYRRDAKGDVKLLCNDSTDRGMKAYYHIDCCKPILRPMSELTKPLPDCTIPIVGLAKIAAEYWGVDFEVDKISPFGAGVRSIDGHEFGFTGLEFYFLDDEEDPIEINQLTYFQYLFEHHFDVYGLIDEGLAIDINTIEL